MYRYKTCACCNGSGKQIDSTLTGQNMRERRKEKQISLREAARRLGWSAAYVSDLERGFRVWNEKKMTKYCEALGI
jgi:transcriptional regulator with XRE-family HTH domain